MNNSIEMKHIGRAGVHVGDDEVSVMDHGAFVALAERLRGAW